MTKINSLQDFVGHVVQIYPGDTRKKYDKVLDISDAGVVFEITKSEDPIKTVGTIWFVAISSSLNFIKEK
jgi:hypothetical protein